MIANIYPPLIADIKDHLPYGCRIVQLKMAAAFAQVHFLYLDNTEHNCRFDYKYEGKAH